jgi:hypothetical protein
MSKFDTDSAVIDPVKLRDYCLDSHPVLCILKTMERSIQLLDVVALLQDHRDLQLIAGQVGTVVEVLAPGVFEVEFSDDAGRTYAMVALKESELIALHYNPVAA